MNRKLKKLLNDEQVLNNISLYEGTELENIFKVDIPEEYRPESQKWFRLPYFLVPFSSKDKLFRNNESDFMYENLVIDESGEKFYPFFMHPVTENAYRSWIGDKYKFVEQKDSSFSCTPTSSVRTLLVKNEKNEKLFFIKLTLLDNIGGVFRKTDWESACNQFQANEIVHNVLKDEPEVEFFEDIAALGIRNDVGFRVSNKYATDFGDRAFYVFGNVIRKVPESLLCNDGKIVCSFSSFTSLLRENESYLSESLKNSKLNFDEYFCKYIFNPLKNYLLRQLLNHGVIFEPHCQNVLIELNENLIPTGKFLYRDFDSVSFDRLIFSIKHKNLMINYLQDALARTSLSANYGIRETLAISFFCHFMDDLINPCLISAVKSGIISSEDKDVYIRKYYSEIKEDFKNLIPGCEEKLKIIESAWNNDMSFFVDMNMNEIREKTIEIKDFDKEKYLRVLVNEPYYHNTKIYALENNEVIFNTKEDKIFEVYLEK